MKIRPVGADLFHADGHMDRQTDRQTWWSWSFLFAIMRTRL